ncbi:maleylpyruvate isomerase N-terminal domain-containing protein, partial [bacterium]|nr:maleylpyruvate isomerase N-terminal domain-containing protein [bacterium]
MDNPLDASQFLERIQGAWQAWNALVGKIDPAQMTQPGVAGLWSVKDIIAHITWHER